MVPPTPMMSDKSGRMTSEPAVIATKPARMLFAIAMASTVSFSFARFA